MTLNILVGPVPAEVHL